MLDDLLFYGVLGVVLGGRLGQVLFYDPGYYFSHPGEIFAVWKGGMSFHGGFLGVLIAVALFAHRAQAPLACHHGFHRAAGATGACRRTPRQLHQRRTVGAGPTPPALGHGLPAGGRRHPAPSLAALRVAGEGLLLFIILWLYARKPRPVGAVSGVFLIGYGSLRFLVEFTREPDSFFGRSNSACQHGPMAVAADDHRRHHHAALVATERMIARLWKAVGWLGVAATILLSLTPPP